MLSGWLLSASAIAYLGFLFAIAFYGAATLHLSQLETAAALYLRLGARCVLHLMDLLRGCRTAVREGWGYLPIYVGPTLVYLLALPFLERLVEVGALTK